MTIQTGVACERPVGLRTRSNQIQTQPLILFVGLNSSRWVSESCLHVQTLTSGSPSHRICREPSKTAHHAIALLTILLWGPFFSSSGSSAWKASWWESWSLRCRTLTDWRLTLHFCICYVLCQQHWSFNNKSLRPYGLFLQGSQDAMVAMMAITISDLQPSAAERVG